MNDDGWKTKRPNDPELIQMPLVRPPRKGMTAEGWKTLYNELERQHANCILAAQKRKHA